MKIKIKGEIKWIRPDDIKVIIRHNDKYFAVDKSLNDIYQVKKKSYNKIAELINSNKKQEMYICCKNIMIEWRKLTIDNKSLLNTNEHIIQEYEDLRTDYDDIIVENKELKNQLNIRLLNEKKYERLVDEIETLKSQYSELEKKYEKLKEESGIVQVRKVDN